MMQLWMDTDSATDYYTANWNFYTITKRSGSSTVWSYNIGGLADAVTTDAPQHTGRHVHFDITLTPQQYRFGLPISILRQHFDLRRRAAADGVLDHDKGIVRQTQHAGYVLRRHFERFGTDHHRSLAQLFKADAVMQTAR